jgi:hypothetical protein
MNKFCTGKEKGNKRKRKGKGKEKDERFEKAGAL